MKFILLGCFVVLSALVMLFRHLARVTRIKKYIRENSEVTLFLYDFIDDKKYTERLTGLSKTDIQNIRSIGVINDLIAHRIISLGDEEMSINRTAYRCLVTYARQTRKAVSKKAGFGDRVLHALKLPHTSDRYASINFDTF